MSEGTDFAMPDHPLRGDFNEALRRVEEVCAAHEAKARFRFLHSFAPEVAPALRAFGYEESESWPILLCTPETFREAEPVVGLEMVTVSHDSAIEDVKENWNTNALGFDMNAALATDEEAEAFRQRLEGCLGFTARLNGQAVSAGMYNPIRHGVTKIVGVTTLAPFRRRGVATYLTAFATQAAFAHGAQGVFLIPADAQAYRVYERIGYGLYSSLVTYEAKSR
jgi:ribosomal protein S18 acetylase RimI-like enzyme